MIAFELILLACLAYAESILIFQCCPKGEGVSPKGVCQRVEQQFKPLVFSPQQGVFLPPTTVPDNFTFVVRVPPCDEHTYFEDPSFAVLTSNNGSLFLENSTLQPETFCISPTGLLMCLPNDHPLKKKKTEKQVRKCCVMDQVYSEKAAACVQLNSTNKVNFLSEDTSITSGFPHCDAEYAITGKLDEDYSLNVDGTLRTKSRQQPVVNFCVEYILESMQNPNEKASIFTCTKSFPSVAAGDQRDIRFTIYPLGLFLSIFFLTMTLISSCMLPSSYHALHWKCQTHYVACLLVGDFLLAVTQLASDSFKHNITCVGIATATHFFFLAAFFWLNTMCFNIWWTFRDLRPTSLDKGQETYRLVLYELYAWGGPFIIVSIGAVMDQVLNDKYPKALRPNFGHTSCWFDGDAELLVYFFGPVGLLLFVNLVLFVATTRELTCGLWKREVVKSTTERTALSHICLKLVIVMGITWIVDVLSWAIGGPNYLWYLTDLVNCLQGVFIFIVVGCQPQVWSAVKRMWCLSDSPSRSGGRSYSSNATPSIINDQSSTKPVETLC